MQCLEGVGLHGAQLFINKKRRWFISPPIVSPMHQYVDDTWVNFVVDFFLDSGPCTLLLVY